MSLMNRIRIELIVMIVIIFLLSFIPSTFETVFFETVLDCKDMVCPDRPHLHWTNQHYIWTFGGVVLTLFQVVTIIIKIEKSFEK